MDELMHLSFQELEALRQYFISTTKDELAMRRPGAIQITEQHIRSIGATIEQKFEDLITTESNGSKKQSWEVG